MNQTRLTDLDLELHKGYYVNYQSYQVNLGQRMPLMVVLLLVIGLGISGAAQSAYAIMIDFDTLVKGEIVNTQFQGSNGVTISGTNADTEDDGPDIVIIFDSNMFSGNDADLTGPGGGGTCGSGCDGDWDGGNLGGGVQEDLEKMIILPEDDTDTSPNDGNVDDPNDEGGRPAGTITIEWDTCVESFGFVIVDQEFPSVEVTDGFVQFFDGATDLGTVQFEWFVDNSLPVGNAGLFFDATVDYGDNHANRVQPVTIADLMTLDNTITSSGWTKAVINLAGSGAFDDIEYEHCVVGGTGMQVESTSLLLAGDQSLSVWLMPVIISGIGIGFFFVRKN